MVYTKLNAKIAINITQDKQKKTAEKTLFEHPNAYKKPEL